MAVTRAAQSRSKDQAPPSASPSLLGLSLVGIISLAALLRIAFLGVKSFGQDEIASLGFAADSWPSFFRTLANSEANATFYYLLLRLWRMLGDSEATIRALSVIFSIATVLLIYLLGSRLLGRRVGVLAAFLITINTYHIEYAQYARGYSLVVFLATLSSLFFLNSLERPSWRNWAAYVVTASLAVYSHLFAALVLLAQWTSLALLPSRDVPWQRWRLSVLWVGLLLLPLGVFAVATGRTQVDWIPSPKLGNIPGVYYVLAGGSGRLAEAGPVGLLLLFTYLALCLLALRQAWSLVVAHGVSWRVWRYGVLFAWLVVPVLLAYAVSLAKPLFIAYYLIVCLPPLVLLGAAGLDMLPKPMAAATLVVVAMLSAHEIHFYYTHPDTEDYRGATLYVLSHAEAGDAVAFYTPDIRYAFEFYRKKLKDTPQQPFAILPTWEELPAHYRRAWLVLSHDQNQKLGFDVISRSIQSFLADRYCSMLERDLAGVRVLRYEKPRVNEACVSP